MRRDTFENLMRVIHFADNQMINKEDPYYKIKPLILEINKLNKIIDLPKYFCVDESIVPYYGRHNTK